MASPEERQYILRQIRGLFRSVYKDIPVVGKPNINIISGFGRLQARSMEWDFSAEDTPQAIAQAYRAAQYASTSPEVKQLFDELATMLENSNDDTDLAKEIDTIFQKHSKTIQDKNVKSELLEINQNIKYFIEKGQEIQKIREKPNNTEEDIAKMQAARTTPEAIAKAAKYAAIAEALVAAPIRSAYFTPSTVQTIAHLLELKFADTDQKNIPTLIQKFNAKKHNFSEFQTALYTYAINLYNNPNVENQQFYVTALNRLNQYDQRNIERIEDSAAARTYADNVTEKYAVRQKSVEQLHEHAAAVYQEKNPETPIVAKPTKPTTSFGAAVLNVILHPIRAITKFATWVASALTPAKTAAEVDLEIEVNRSELEKPAVIPEISEDLNRINVRSILLRHKLRAALDVAENPNAKREELVVAIADIREVIEDFKNLEEQVKILKGKTTENIEESSDYKQIRGIDYKGLGTRLEQYEKRAGVFELQQANEYIETLTQSAQAGNVSEEYLIQYVTLLHTVLKNKIPKINEETLESAEEIYELLTKAQLLLVQFSYEAKEIQELEKTMISLSGSIGDYYKLKSSSLTKQSEGALDSYRILIQPNAEFNITRINLCIQELKNAITKYGKEENQQNPNVSTLENALIDLLDKSIKKLDTRLGSAQNEADLKLLRRQCEQLNIAEQVEFLNSNAASDVAEKSKALSTSAEQFLEKLDITKAAMEKATAELITQKGAAIMQAENALSSLKEFQQVASVIDNSDTAESLLSTLQAAARELTKFQNSNNIEINSLIQQLTTGITTLTQQIAEKFPTSTTAKEAQQQSKQSSGVSTTIIASPEEVLAPQQPQQGQQQTVGGENKPPPPPKPN